MNPIHAAYVWLNDPLNWTNPDGIMDRLGRAPEHSGAAVADWACLVAWPIGLWLGHTGGVAGCHLALANLTLAHSRQWRC